MQTINSTQFRSHVADYLSAVEQGDLVVIMRHGKAVAKLSPITEADKLASWQRPVPRIKIKGNTLSQAILAERNDSKI